MNSNRFKSTSGSIHLIILAIGLLFTGCARSFNPNIERGSGYIYRDGYPEVRFSAIGFLNENDEPGINIAADIVYGSLIFKKSENDSLRADIAIDVQILDQENKDNIIKTNRFDFEIVREDPDIVYSQEVFTFEERIPVESGRFVVNFTLIDQTSGKQITGSTQTYIPDPEDNVVNLTNIRMLGKDVDARNSEWSPITTYDVQGKVDSLQFIFQVTNNKSKEPMNVVAELIRFESDTTAARPMHYNDYSPSTIQYKGIDYDEREVIQSTKRTLSQPGSVLIKFKFPQQERGNYRFEVKSDKPAGDSELFKARDFSVKSMNYPSIQSPRELARPLIYLMDNGDYEDMMAIQNPDSLKQEVDRFWLRHIGNSSKAKQVIRMYYERVEEANKQFSNFKEGWKTDTGMIYVLFGPPWYVEQHLDRMVWSYAYNRNDPEYNYLFHQPKLHSEFYPFNSYLLRRNQYYFQVQYQQLQLWLSGQILNRSI